MKRFILPVLLFGAIVGCQGPMGNDGFTGATGSQGPAGVNGNGYLPGLACNVYSVLASDERGTISWNALLTEGTLKFSTVLSGFNVPNESSNSVFASFTAAQQALIGTTNYALDCSGLIDVPASGTYNIMLASDDGSQVVIDNTVIDNMPQLQAMSSVTHSVYLYAGLHRINVMYFQGPPTNLGLQLSWKGPANDGLGTMSIIPSSVLQH